MTDQTKAALCYVLGFITGFLFLVANKNKNSEFIRKSAGQSIVISILYLIAVLAFNAVPFVGNILCGCLSIIFFILWVLLIIKANNNIYYRVPAASILSEKYLLKWL
jgi:uncharacterized membrane protein